MGRGARTGTALLFGVLAACGGGGAAPGGTPQFEIWRPAVGDMLSVRYHHTLTLLQDGRVLAVGTDARAELFDPRTELWAYTGTMSVVRTRHRAVLLHDGRVLAIGGQVERGLSTSSVEAWSPATGQWTNLAPLSEPRQEHTATVLEDGRVLVTGGIGQGNVTHGGSDDFGPADLKGVLSGEIYDPATGRWTNDGTREQGLGHEAMQAAVLLADGHVLVMGGYFKVGYPHFGPPMPGGFGSPLPSPPLPVATALDFDPVTGVWRHYAEGDGLNVRRYGGTALRLDDGTVVLVGGFTEGPDVADRYTRRYDLWDATDGLRERHDFGAATRLRDGTVLVTGGYVCDGACASTPNVERYVPGRRVYAAGQIAQRNVVYTGTWRAAPPMDWDRGAHAAVLLESGDLLVTGGFSQTLGNLRSAEIFAYSDLSD
jgi:hypothetical protein